MNYKFNEIEIIDKNTVLKLIKKSAAKSCELDLVLTNLLKQYVEVLVPSVHYIITTSLSHGCFTDNLKEALLRPLLKKSNLDLIFKTYHPISNLTSLSKLVEKAVCNQITSFAAQTNNMEKLICLLSRPFNENCIVKGKNRPTAALDKKYPALYYLI